MTMDAYGAAARVASRALAVATAAEKSAALEAMADSVARSDAAILEANASDMEDGRSHEIGEALLDRLFLNESRVEGMVNGLRKVAGLQDPVGVQTGGWSMHNGIRVQRVRAPLGVVAVIYEARPNVTADAAGLCVKSGNAALLRGSSYALQSNRAIGDALRTGLEKVGLPVDGVQVIEDTSRQGAQALMTAREWVDLLVPRGGPGLISAVEENATVPFVIDGAGNCHVYVDAAADLEAARRIVVNAKCQRPGVCNAAEKLLVHSDVADTFIPTVVADLIELGVEVRGDERTRALADGVIAASADDWGTEYHDLIIAVAVVDDLVAATDHIAVHGSRHTEAIITEDYSAAQTFISSVDAAVTMVNASTRFTDGEEFGFGAEIGISTQKLHVRGPMGLEALTSERYVLFGDGHTR